ncbi:MAG: type IV pilin-like G/H family protein, partial [Nostoc sp.]
RANTFATSAASFGNLGLGIATQTSNYKYNITGNASQVTNQAHSVIGSAPLKTYLGGVGVATQAATSEATTIAILCEAAQARVNGGADGTASADFTTSGNGWLLD